MSLSVITDTHLSLLHLRIDTLERENFKMKRELLSQEREMRFNATVAAMQGILTNQTRPSSPEAVVDHAIACADKLLERFTIN